jgi:hypothetical protein
MTAPVMQELAIRRATDADKPFMLALAKECYPDRGIERGVPWVEWCMANSERLVLVGPNSFGIARVEWIYGFERRSGMDMLCARKGTGFEAFRMVRVMLRWAKESGAKGEFKLEADTGVDFGPFARRLGGRSNAAQWYMIPL